jgi:hypothetical protein
MFRNDKIPKIFERVAEPAEWQEFCALEPADELGCWIVSLGGPPTPPTPYEIRVLRYRELWRKFTEMMRTKLSSGEWVADGFNPQLGVRPVQIDPRLWGVLEFVLGEDVVEGHGYKFSNLFFSAARDGQLASHAQLPHLRTELTRWIEAQAQSATGPMTAKQVLEAARRAFSGTTISNNLFGQAWRAAAKPEHFRQRGRPKAKVVRK